jgi:hypothetical protein
MPEFVVYQQNLPILGAFSLTRKTTLCTIIFADV